MPSDSPVPMRPGLMIPATGAVGSPCISVCRINEVSGLCEGCLRTLVEIAAWGAMDDDERRDVLHQLDQRVTFGS